MSPATLRGATAPIRIWAPPHEVESVALDQLRRIADLPWVHHHVAAMPDVHLGKGATVGSVIAMHDAVSPAAVGVDIGCGMAAVRTNLTASDLPDDLSALRGAVEAAIPVGFAAHDAVSKEVDRLPLWKEFEHLTPAVHARLSRAQHQLGTLGGGNHFLELCLDDGRPLVVPGKGAGVTGAGGRELGVGGSGSGTAGEEFGAAGEESGAGEPRVWIMLHSGSRNIGKELAEHHIGVAKRLSQNQDLPDRDLAVFLAGTPEMDAYRHDLFWAQDYARANRELMLRLYQQVLTRFLPRARFGEPISCHHNYVSAEHHYGADVLVTRKGAISAAAGQLGIIPGSMGTSSYIVRGLGNPESFCSASHGAGRRMSRGAAKRQFTLADLQAQTAGIECRKDAGVLDEIPGAYKDIDQVMANQSDLVEVVVRLRQVMCVKG
jgi:tRNA-splicing ligase RtcB